MRSSRLRIINTRKIRYANWCKLQYNVCVRKIKRPILRGHECDGYFVTLSIALRPEVHISRNEIECQDRLFDRLAGALLSAHRNHERKSHPWIPSTIVQVYDCPTITGVRQSLRGLSRFHLWILSSRRAIWIKEDRSPPRPGPIVVNENIPVGMRRAVYRSYTPFRERAI